MPKMMSNTIAMNVMRPLREYQPSVCVLVLLRACVVTEDLCKGTKSEFPFTRLPFIRHFCLMFLM